MLSRRKRLMLLYTFPGLGVVLVAIVAAWTLQPEPNRYIPGERVEGITDSLDRKPAPLDPVSAAAPDRSSEDKPALPHFSEVAREAGIDFTHFQGIRSTQLPEDMGSGAAWGDYDGDGYPDLFICNIAGPLTASSQDLQASPASNRLYRNRGNGTFEDLTDRSGLASRGFSMAAAWGDYDGDGDLDLVVTRYGTNLLYRNDGGAFTEVSREAGLHGPDGFWTGASWGDYDGDGFLDLYICGYVQYHFDPSDSSKSTSQYKAAVPFTLNPSSYSPERNLFYRNNGDGTFTEKAAEAGIQNDRGRSLAAAWCDFDLDGRLDLYVANDISDNVMYRNQGDGTFADISHPSWVADYRGAMGLGVGDWDNDGDPDIFVTHWLAQENALYSNMTYVMGLTSRSEKLTFMDIADQVGVGAVALDYVGWGTFFFDFDNDGLQDIFVANGSTFQERDQPHQLVPMRSLLFRNGGEEAGFFEIGRDAGPAFLNPRVSRGAAFADYDQDGDLDILVVNHGAPPLLLRNNLGNGSHWLKVRLQGNGANRFGLGAVVEIAGRGIRQWQQVGSQPSYLSQNPFELHFGLGTARQVDELKVTFLSGKLVRLENVAAGQTVTVQE